MVEANIHWSVYCIAGHLLRIVLGVWIGELSAYSVSGIGVPGVDFVREVVGAYSELEPYKVRVAAEPGCQQARSKKAMKYSRA